MGGRGDGIVPWLWRHQSLCIHHAPTCCRQAQRSISRKANSPLLMCASCSEPLCACVAERRSGASCSVGCEGLGGVALNCASPATLQVIKPFIAKYIRPVPTVTPTKGSYVKNDAFEEAVVAGSPMLAALRPYFPKETGRGFNYAVCDAAKPAYAADTLEPYGSGDPCYVVAQGRSITDGGFGSSDGPRRRGASTLFLNNMTEKEVKSEFQNKIKLLNTTVRGTVRRIPSCGE